MARPRFVRVLFALCLAMVGNTLYADVLAETKTLIRAKHFDAAIERLETLHKTAEGTGASHYLLGSLYWWQGHQGKGIAKPLAELEKAVDLEYPRAMHRLGMLYLAGTKVPQDLTRGFKLLSRAVELGYQLADAQVLQAQADFFDMEEWDACALIDYRRSGELLLSDHWSESIKERAFFCAVAASNLDALEMWRDRGWGLYHRNPWGQSALHVAINARSYLALDWLLKQGVSVDAVDDRGNTPLHLAMALEDLASIEPLLQHKAHWSALNEAGLSPLDVAVGDEVRTYALRRGAASAKKQTKQGPKSIGLIYQKAPRSGVFAGWSPLHVAAWLGKDDVVQALLPSSTLTTIDPEGYTPLMRAACAGHHKIYQNLRKETSKQPIPLDQKVALLWCFADHKWHQEFSQMARNLDTKLIDTDKFLALLRRAAEADFAAEIPLLLASERNDKRLDTVTLKRIVKLNQSDLISQSFALAAPAIQQGVLFDALKYGWRLPTDILKKSAMNGWLDSEFNTPLIASSSAGNVDAVKALIPLSEVDVQNKTGNTALHSAVLANHLESVQALLMSGCDVEVRNEESLTPLMLAVDSADKEIINALVAAGANPNRRDKFGVSVVERARRAERLELENAFAR